MRQTAPERGINPMTMFSMKPQFDLAEFLAKPATPGTRPRNRQFGRQAPRPPKAEPVEGTSEAEGEIKA